MQHPISVKPLQMVLALSPDIKIVQYEVVPRDFNPYFVPGWIVSSMSLAAADIYLHVSMYESIQGLFVTPGLLLFGKYRAVSRLLNNTIFTSSLDRPPAHSQVMVPPQVSRRGTPAATAAASTPVAAVPAVRLAAV